MKKIYLIVLMVCRFIVTNGQDFWIHAVGSSDVCYPATVTLSVDSPQPGYTYYWYIFGGIGCVAYPGNLPYGSSGVSIQAEFAGVYYCAGVPPSGSNPEYSNDEIVRVLTTIPGFGYMPAPGLNSNNNCVTSSSFCIPGIYHAYWPFNSEIRWYKNNTLISGAYTDTYTATSSGYYKYSITSDCTTAFSDSTFVTITPSAQVTTSGSTTFCSGGSVVLNAPSGTNKTYQWKKGANIISGATLSSYTATTGGNYKVIVTNSVTGCSKTTGSPTAVTVNALPAATITPQGPTTFCAGGSVVLSANTGTGLSYKWKKASNYIPGATLSNYTATTGGNYKVQVTNSNGCSKTSGNITVSVPCKEGKSVKAGEGESELDFTVYPNPNSGEFTIRFSNKPSSPLLIELTDEIGKIVKKFETNDETLTIKESNLANGIYCLSARSNNEVAITKINIVK